MSSRRHARLSLIAGTLAALSWLPVAQAADHAGADRGSDNQPDEYHWGLGLGVGSSQSPYIGKKDVDTAIPVLTYENRYVRLFGNLFDVKLPSIGAFDFSLRSKIAVGQGYSSSDSTDLTGMDSRKGSIYLGGAATWRSPLGKASFEYLHDASGHSKGANARLGFEHAFTFARRFEVTPYVGVARQDAKEVDYYYGVRESEATAARPAYSGTSTTVTDFGVRFGYAIDQKQRLLLDIADQHYGKGITNSPIVGRSSTLGVKAAYVYRF
jgi:outer membrane protein